MKIENGWVPVALSSSIEAGTSAGAIVGSAELVVWRDNSGKAHVWEDRCPHRGMRLSFGFVRGDHIACLYHGWQFDAAGQCRHIPAHPDLDVPQTIKVPRYQAREQFGIVWATAAEDASLPPLSDGLELTSLRSLYVDCPQDDALAALSGLGISMLADNCGDCVVDGTPLIIALQVVGPEKTALHIVVKQAAGAEQLKSLSRWTEAFRLSLESPELAEVA